jgi:crotonobetainyl-CoA:carnitine CoA-transferase CaiB-like acyl-CoA transferase
VPEGSTPLEGIKVLEVAEHSFVPSAAAVLGDWGAMVVKVERPAGDANRRNMQWGYAPDTGDVDMTMEQVNRNKRGIVVDLTVPEGRRLLDRLIGWADVFITNQLPPVRKKLHLEPGDVFAVNPGIVYARGSAVGERGPEGGQPGYDAVSYWARGGIGDAITPVGMPLVNPLPAFGDVIGGMFLAGGIAAALVASQRDGEGRVVDISLLSSAVWCQGVNVAATSVLGTDPPRWDHEAVRFSPLVNHYATADDRWLSLIMLDEARYWPALCEALADPELRDDARFADPDARLAHRRELRECIRTRIVRRPLAEWVERLGAAGCIFAPQATMTELLADPQVLANGYTPALPGLPGARIAANPIQFDQQPPVVRRRAPAIGEHTGEFLAELGLSAPDIAQLRAAGAIN